MMKYSKSTPYVGFELSLVNLFISFKFFYLLELIVKLYFFSSLFLLRRHQQMSHLNLLLSKYFSLNLIIFLSIYSQFLVIYCSCLRINVIDFKIWDYRERFLLLNGQILAHQLFLKHFSAKFSAYVLKIRMLFYIC